MLENEYMAVPTRKMAAKRKNRDLVNKENTPPKLIISIPEKFGKFDQVTRDSAHYSIKGGKSGKNKNLIIKVRL